VNTHRHHDTTTTTTTPAATGAARDDEDGHVAARHALDLLRDQTRIRHGRAAVLLDEDDDPAVIAEGHDRRALAALNACGREEHGHQWATGDTPARIWVLIIDTCGCTPDQHAEHDQQADTDPDWDGCPCEQWGQWGLPPCEPDRFPWICRTVPAGTPGAIAATEVRW